MSPMRILVAVDLSPASEALVRFAARLAARVDGELLLMHVYGADEAVAVQHEAGLCLDRFLEHLRGELGYLLGRTGEGPGRARIVIAEGAPVDAILDRAAQDDVQMIVVGTHGRTGFSRLLMGSVAEGVLRRARCPVVVMPYSAVADREPELAAQART
jgi:nucleotide-binding universal stress UspA family protein